MNNVVINTEVDRRGRIYAAGIFLGYENEVETFKRLAEKYLLGSLREVALLSDPPKLRFRALQDEKN